jgi:hypothetical protein
MPAEPVPPGPDAPPMSDFLVMRREANLAV